MTIKFAAPISKQGDKRIIIIPTKIHKKIEKMTDQVLVQVSEL